MMLHLKDIIDLDFLLGLDEGPDSGDNAAISARDRDIYRQLADSEMLDDAGLIAGWLAYRRLLFFHETGNGGPGARLPGDLFDTFYTWTARGAFACGLAAGGTGAYTFLAYHGSRPVNVTLFIAVFILFPALLCLSAGLLGLAQFRSGAAGGSWSGVLHRLFLGIFLNKFADRVRKWAAPVKSHLPELPEDANRLLHLDTRPFRRMLFWPVFIALSLGALGFSVGAFAGTFFRIMVTDLAFGWQSTLISSGDTVHHLVSWMALPWSWVMPDGFAVPGLEQIEGSRIILKEGIAGLASEHLAAWWPFLCMGMLVYALMPRIILVGLAHAARNITLARFDLSMPGYQRLIMRMRTPSMGTDIMETGGTRATFRGPLPRPVTMPVEEDTGQKVIMPQPDKGSAGCGDEPEPSDVQSDFPGAITEPPCPSEACENTNSRENCENANAPQPVSQTETHRTGALVLGSARGFQGNTMEKIKDAIERQFGVNVAATAGIQFDFEADRETLLSLSGDHGKGPVVLLQEVWQPPIRGLLYYFVQIREHIFPHAPLWIVMVQTLDQGDMDVETADVNFQVWKTAVSQLNDPKMIIERWVSP